MFAFQKSIIIHSHINLVTVVFVHPQELGEGLEAHLRLQINPRHPQQLPWVPCAFAVMPFAKLKYKFTFSS